MLWQFENPIILPQKPLTSNEATQTLDETDNRLVILRAEHSTEGFTDADWFMLEGQGFASSDEAYAAGRRWRQLLSVAFAHAGFVVLLDSVVLETQDGERERSLDAPGLRVVPQPENLGGLAARLRLAGGRMRGKVTRPLELFMLVDLPAAYESVSDGLAPRVELAYTTFHAASAVDSSDVKYILFVTAIEALIDDDVSKSEDIVQGLNLLRKHIKDDDAFANVRGDLRNLLKEDESESISQLGQQLASKLEGQYGEKNSADFFKQVYSARSGLVHGALEFTGSRRRPTAEEIAQTLPELQRFVVDLIKESSKPAEDD